MANLSRSKHGAPMARSSGGDRCKKHPKHKQSPGVCSLCLTQRLSQLPFSGLTLEKMASGSKMPSSSSSSSLSSLSSCYSSSSASSCSSPYQGRVFRRKSSIPMVLLFKRRGDFLSSRFRGDDHGDGDKKKEKKKSDGFWSKLIMTRRGKEIVEDSLKRSSSIIHQTTTAATNAN